MAERENRLMEDFEDDLREDVTRSRNKALEMLPSSKDRSARDVRQLMEYRDILGDDNATVFLLRGRWHKLTKSQFYTRLALAMMYAGWSYIRRYKALKIVKAEDQDIVQVYGNNKVLDELEVRLEYRLDMYDAKREGVLTIAESGDDCALVRALYSYNSGHGGQTVLDMRGVLGWYDGTYGLQRMANALRFGLGWNKIQITAAWNAADVLEARAIADVLEGDKP